MLALLETFDREASGDAVEAALRAEAEAVIAEATADHGALVTHALAALPPRRPVAGDEAEPPLRVLTLGSTGAMGSGQFGTAVSAIITAHHEGRPVHALVAETRPLLEGARVAAWELGQAGVAHALVTDAAAPGRLAAGEVDVVLVTAERIAANGDVLATTGTYPIALDAQAAGVPLHVLAATAAVDPATATGADAAPEQGRPGPVLSAGGTRIAPAGTQVRNPRLDLTPASLVTAIVTEAGVVTSPFGPTLEAHVAAARTRRAAAPGFAAMLAGTAG
jgi:methylthioribose-1-phosphate isomerase